MVKIQDNELAFNDGRSLLKASQETPLLLVLVRHKGCTFCRETLGELKRHLPQILATGVQPVVVHMGSEEDSSLLNEMFELDGVEFIADPKRVIYGVLGARRGNLFEVIGPQTWWKGFKAGVLKGHGIGQVHGDAFQLGGSFLLHQGKVKQLHRPENSADIENWPQLIAHIDEF